ncbi:MAG: substrate-binding domain-containing protein [Anaerolineae bacterium]|nr:substrate-binding domain-containing protein [Anaerolineae bacterium]
MPPTPRLNKLLLILYGLATLGVLIAALVSPEIRALAYAPLRDIIIPPPKPVVVHVLYSTEKAAWITEAVDRFQATRPRVVGRPIELVLEKSGSREMYLAVLDGTAEPDLISPASQLQIALLQDLSAARTDLFRTPVVNQNDIENCRPVLETPVVLVAWKNRADVLWGNDPNGRMWLRLHEAVTEQNWDSFGHPEWGYIKFGQTNPLKSNSGFQAMVLMTYNYFQKTDNLTNNDVLDPGFQEWYTEFGRNVAKFGDSTGTFMEEIVAYGPSQYDIVAVYEATAIEHIENAIARYGEEQGGLRIYYPPATSMSDHPFCVLNADWVAPEEAEAARLFLNFLTDKEMQELALTYGFRPVDTSIPLDSPGSPFLRYLDSGLELTLKPEVAVPPGNVLDTLLTFWQRAVRP